MPAKPVIPAEVADELASNIEFLTEVTEARGDLTKLGRVCEELCTHYRALGICMLSEDADLDGFFHHLIQSAITRRFYLQGIAGKVDAEPQHSRASFLDPVFDAIAARQWTLTQELLELAPRAWSQGEEYEDDFCYADFLRLLLTEPTATTDAVIARWTAALEGGEDLRLELAHALRKRDPSELASALRNLLQKRNTESGEIAHPEDGSLLADEATFFPNWWISVEGLALLAIAERMGMRVEGEFPSCPALARTAEFGPFVSRGYPNVLANV